MMDIGGILIPHGTITRMDVLIEFIEVVFHFWIGNEFFDMEELCRDLDNSTVFATMFKVK